MVLLNYKFHFCLQQFQACLRAYTKTWSGARLWSGALEWTGFWSDFLSMLGLAKVTRGPRWPCIAHLITSQVSSQLAFSVQEKKFNINFQDGCHLGFPIRMILATFDPQVTLILAMKFWSIGCLVQKKKFQIDFQHGGEGDRLRFPSGTIVAIFDTQVNLIPVLPSKFQVMWSFHSGEEIQNRLSRQRLWWPSWISDQNNISYFLFKSHPDTSYQVTSQFAFWLRRWKLAFWLRRWSAKQIFKMAAIFDFQSELF